MSEKFLALVWLTEERRVAGMVSLHAHYAIVKYIEDGVEYEVMITTDDFEYLEGFHNDTD